MILIIFRKYISEWKYQNVSPGGYLLLVRNTKMWRWVHSATVCTSGVLQLFGNDSYTYFLGYFCCGSAHNSTGAVRYSYFCPKSLQNPAPASFWEAVQRHEIGIFSIRTWAVHFLLTLVHGNELETRVVGGGLPSTTHRKNVPWQY